MVTSERMQIDENTPGSVAHAESVRVIKGWLLALYIVDALVCVLGALSLRLSMPSGFWILFKSLFFSYFLGIVGLLLVIRLWGRLIGLTKMTQLAFLKYCLVLASLSVLMSGSLLYRASTIITAQQSAKMPIH